MYSSDRQSQGSQHELSLDSGQVFVAMSAAPPAGEWRILSPSAVQGPWSQPKDLPQSSDRHEYLHDHRTYK